MPKAEVDQELPRLWRQGLRPTDHLPLTWPLAPFWVGVERRLRIAALPSETLCIRDLCWDGEASAGRQSQEACGCRILESLARVISTWPLDWCIASDFSHVHQAQLWQKFPPALDGKAGGMAGQPCSWEGPWHRPLFP